MSTFALFPFTALIVAVAGQARESSHCVGMAGAAGCMPMVDACSLLIDTRFSVRNIELCGNPGSRVVAILAIRSENSKVEGRIFMASDTLD